MKPILLCYLFRVCGTVACLCNTMQYPQYQLQYKQRNTSFRRGTSISRLPLLCHRAVERCSGAAEVYPPPPLGTRVRHRGLPLSRSIITLNSPALFSRSILPLDFRAQVSRSSLPRVYRSPAHPLPSRTQSHLPPVDPDRSLAPTRVLLLYCCTTILLY